MKLLTLSTIAILIFAAGPSFAQSEMQPLEKRLSDMAVTNLQIEGSNINKLLAQIAYKYDVPISLEVATNEDLLKSKTLTVQLKKATLADVLDDIVRQKPAYTWEVSESSIRVFPKSEFRDPLLQSLLELRIDRFVLPKRAAKLTFRQTLSNRPEFKSLLASYGVSSSIEVFSAYDIAPFGNDFSLDVENATVRSILDSIIRASPIKYWFINRHGDNRQYLVINF